MKIILLAFIILITSSFAVTNEKRIVFEKFEDMAAAQTKFEEFKNSRLYTELEALASGNDIKIHICSSDEYVAIVANPIENKYILSEITNIIQKEFTESFDEEFSGRCDVVAKIEKNDESDVEDTFLDELLQEFEDENTSKKEDENISEATTKIEKSKEDILEEARLVELKKNLEVIKLKEMAKNNEPESWFSWWYIFWLVIFAYGYKMYKKYKPIYDEY